MTNRRHYYGDSSISRTHLKRKRNLDDWLLLSKPDLRGSGSRLDEGSSTRTVISGETHPQRVCIDLTLDDSDNEFETSSRSATANEKPLVSLSSILRDNTTFSSKPKKLAPLTLTTPEMVSTHTPLTMHPSILPLELSCRLYYAMLKASEGWTRNKWWLADRMVESPHTTSFYARHAEEDDYDWNEAAQYWYAGRPTGPPLPFLPEMEEACGYIEKAVNEAIRQRPRYSLEWAGAGEESKDEVPQWRPNVAAANCYRGAKEAVGYHSDQMTCPYPTIASLSLGTTREFRVREVIPKENRLQREARTYIVPLPHNSLVIMHPPCQERFKHTVPSQQAIDMFRPPFPHDAQPSNARINITFRFYRPDFRPHTTPRCACGDPCVLRADMKGKWKKREQNSSEENKEIDYFWQCYSSAQNEGKSCGHWRLMDVKKEGRGPVIGSGS
ncbi:2OG-Fe(II) oxygenase superfamily, partial [Rhizoctonia solani]